MVNIVPYFNLIIDVLTKKILSYFHGNMVVHIRLNNHESRYLCIDHTYY